MTLGFQQIHKLFKITLCFTDMPRCVRLLFGTIPNTKCAIVFNQHGRTINAEVIPATGGIGLQNGIVEKFPLSAGRIHSKEQNTIVTVCAIGISGEKCIVSTGIFIIVNINMPNLITGLEEVAASNRR